MDTGLDESMGRVPIGIAIGMSQAGLTVHAFRVALILLAHAGKNSGETWISNETIVEETGLDIRNVKKGVKRLVERGVVKVCPPGYRGRASNTYQFMGWPMARKQPTSEAPSARAEPSRPADDWDWGRPHTSTPQTASGDEEAGITQPKPEIDKIKSVLRKGGVMGHNLNKLASHPEMTVGLAKRLVKQASTAEKPGAVAFILWRDGWRGEGQPSRETDEPDHGCRPFTMDEFAAYQAGIWGITVEQYNQYQEEARPLYEAWKADPQGMTELQFKEEVTDPLYLKITGQEFFNG